MGIQKTPYQKTYKLQVDSQEFTVDFNGCKRQFDWLEISLVSDKNNKHTTIYHSYNAKWMARILRSVELGNILDAYSIINTMKFDTSNNTQKHMLWMQYVAWHCNGYSRAPVSDYINNPVFQELFLHESKYFDKVYIDLQDSLGYTSEMEKPSQNNSKLTATVELKHALMHKMRLRVWGYSNSAYLYMAVNDSLTLKYKTYTIKLMDNELEA